MSMMVHRNKLRREGADKAPEVKKEEKKVETTKKAGRPKKA